VPWGDTSGRIYRLADPITETSFICSGGNLRNGLYVELGPWRWHVFDVEQVPQRG
jgi:hypothetical protein